MLNHIEAQTALDWFHLGKNAYDQLLHQKAVEYFTCALELDPSLLRAYILRALAYEQLLILDKPEVDFTEVQRLSPNSAEALFAQAMMDAESDEQVIDRLSLAIQADPTFDEAYLQRAIHYGHLDRVEESLKDFEKVLHISPHNLHVLEERHIVFAQKKDFMAAIKDLFDYMERTGKRPTGLCLQLAYYYAQHNKGNLS